MKKILITLTILVMSVLVLASCEGEQANNGNNNQNGNTCAHLNQVELPETNSTCVKVGYTSGIQCMDCGEFIVAQAEKPLLAHREQDIAARAATCNTDGVTESKRCVMCLRFTVPAQKVPKLNHVIDGVDMVVKSEDVAATCTESGSTGGTHCSVCFATVTPATVVPPLGHNIVVTDAVAPTCQADGCTEKKECTTCNTVFVESVTVEKSDDFHDFEWVVDENDATKENGTCKVEGCTATSVRDVVSVDEGGAED